MATACYFLRMRRAHTPMKKEEVCIVRLGHRKLRDQRITTHVFLTARAFGASEGALCGDLDDSVISGLQKVCSLWGGKVSTHYEADWKKFVKKRKELGWKVAHLTMYGEDFAAGAKKLRGKKLLVLVGAGKVPREAYELADCNLAVGNQPHSEVAAVALFLDRYFGGKEMEAQFGGKLSIVPNKCGKVVLRV